MKTVFLALAIGFLGCSSGAVANNAGDGGGGDDSGSTGDGGTSGPGIATTSIGPIDLAAGEEKTVCINKRLDNTEDIVGTAFDSTLAPGSHHLIVYRSKATSETLTPYACSPFQGVIQGADAPFLIITKGHLEYSLP